MGSFVMYSSLRLVLFLVALLGLYLVGARGLLLVVLAAAVSGAVSYLFLRGPRDKLAIAISDRVEGKSRSKFQKTVAEDAALEDAAADATGPSSESPPTERR